MQQRQKDIGRYRDQRASEGKAQPLTPEDVVREQTRAMTTLEKDILHQMQISNRLGLADRKTAVYFVSSGSGTFNADLRRTFGLQKHIPKALLDAKVVKFKPLHLHFKLLETGKSNPRYIDFLEKGVGLNFLTAKPQNGPCAFYRPTRHMTGPNKRDYTARQIELFFAKSEAMDICTNVMDYIVVRNEDREPVANYTIAMDGSPQFLSNLAHTSSMIPHRYERVKYDLEGKPYVFQNGTKKGQKVYVDIGSFKRGWPIREADKESIVNICNDLEVDDSVANPFRMVKYPVENGDLTQAYFIKINKIFSHQNISKFLGL